MYSLRAYGDMIGDVGRFDAYARAISKAVRPDDVVAEIGCGPGVFSFLACRAGARKVYAIDSADIVHFAAELAAANGLSEKITLIQSDSRKVQLPERVNVIVSDIRGNLPLFDDAISSIEDARERFLAPGGVLIPQRDTLKLAVVDADEYYSGLISPWSRRVQGLELASTHSLVLNEQYGVRFESGQRKTVVSGHEDGHGRVFAADLPQRLKAVHHRHLHVQEHQLRAQFASRRHRLRAGRAFRGQGHRFAPRQQLAQPQPRRSFIVDDQRAWFGRHQFHSRFRLA